MAVPGRGRVAIVVWILAAGALLLVPVSMLLSWPAFERVGADLWVNVGLALACPVAGALILNRMPNLVGWLLMSSGVAAALTLFGFTYAERALVDHPGSLPGAALAVWITALVWPLGALPVITLLPLLFPDGRLLSRAWIPVASCAVAAIAVNVIDGATVPEMQLMDDATVSNPIGGVAVEPVRNVLRALVLICLIVAFAGAAASVVVRWRRSLGIVRQQLKWFVVSVLTTVLLAAAVTTVVTGVPANLAATAIGLLIPTAVAIAVLRHRLYGIDVLVNHALVYGVVTAILLGLYLAVVAAVSAALSQQPTGLAASLIATGLVAVAFSPVRDSVQRRINRLLYGDRNDPSAALDRLGDRLAREGVSDGLLDLLAESISEALRVPYVAVSAGGVNGTDQTVSVGQRRDEPRVIRLVDRGSVVGELEVGRRSAREHFSRQDERLLQVLTRQAALLLHADQLQRDLQRSQTRLIAAVEDERRRLRRDLHDELGPTLAGIALSAETITNLLDGRQLPAKVADRLDRIRGQAQAAADDVRRLVYGLRPPALDELGLAGALSAYADQLAGPAGLVVHVNVAGNTTELPAAVEVAAYRIATEALANARRHGAARTATVSLDRNTDLLLEIYDDGCGLPADWRPGVGVTSMRERATRLGGTLHIESIAAGGTRVSAQIPVRTP